MIKNQNLCQKLIETPSTQYTIIRCLKLAMYLVLACGLTVACQDSTPKSSYKVAAGKVESVKSDEASTVSTSPVQESGDKHAKPGSSDKDKGPISVLYESRSVKKDLRNVDEVVPPLDPGELDVAAPEIQARIAASYQTPPDTIEVIPPEDGEPAVTAAELKARIKAAGETPPDTIEVIPPEDGKPAVTEGEFRARMEAADETQSDTIEVIPPEDGKSAVTEAELKSLREAAEQTPAEYNEAIPPEEPHGE